MKLVEKIRSNAKWLMRSRGLSWNQAQRQASSIVDNDICRLSMTIQFDGIEKTETNAVKLAKEIYLGTADVERTVKNRDGAKQFQFGGVKYLLMDDIYTEPNEDTVMTAVKLGNKVYKGGYTKEYSVHYDEKGKIYAVGSYDWQFCRVGEEISKYFNKNVPWVIVD